MRDAHDAEDVVQDAYLRALKYFDGFRGTGPGDSRAWLLAIVRNTAYTVRRSRRADERATEFDEALHSEAVADDHPEAAVVSQSERAELHRAIAPLPPQSRAELIRPQAE